MEKLTVVIPTYNRANYLKEAIQGILNQSFKDFKLIILDNASSDNTTDIVKTFKDERISYIKNEKNIGMISNLNKAIEICETEYLIICHDDDIAEDTLLEKELNIIDSDPDISIVASNVKLIDGKGIIKKERVVKLHEDKIFNQKEYIKALILKGNFLCFPTVMFRLKVLKDNNLRFREEVGPACDAYLWLELNLLPFKFYLISEPLYRYRMHSEQISKQKNIKMQLMFYDKLKPFLTKNGFADSVSRVAHRYYFGIMNGIIEQTIFNGLTKEQYKIYKDKMKLLGIKRQFKIGNIEIKLYSKLFLMKIAPKLLLKLLNLKRGVKK